MPETKVRRNGAQTGIPTPDKPRQADVRWPADQVVDAYIRLALLGFTAGEAADFLDYLAVVRRVRRLGAFMASLDADELLSYRARAVQLLGEVQRANRTKGGDA